MFDLPSFAFGALVCLGVLLIVGTFTIESERQTCRYLTGAPNCSYHMIPVRP